MSSYVSFSGLCHAIPLGDKLERIGSFLGKVITNFEEVGSIFPSSPWLAEEMVSHMEPGSKRKPRRFLEVGAGSGAITAAILPLLGPKDHLDIIECDKTLADKVRMLVSSSGKAHRVKVHTVYAQNFTSNIKYDHIFSSLPLTNFSASLVKEIYHKFDSLLKEKGKLTYFEYIAIGTVKRKVLSITGANSFHELDNVIRIKMDYRQGKPVKVKWVLSNLPPAWVIHLSKN